MKIDYIKCGDSAELMGEIPDESISLTVTSPPYDDLRTYDGYAFDFKRIAQELFRVTVRGGVVVWIVNDATVKGSESGTSFRQALYFKDIGFNLHDTMIWKKDSCAFPDSNRYYQNFEYMFVFSKGKPRVFNAIRDRRNKCAGMRVHGTFRNRDGTTTDRSQTWKESVCRDFGVRFNVWEQPSVKANKTGHPAPFPLKLAREHILSWSDEGDVVLDPFLGSGTTALAAAEANRHYIGFEISERWCDVARLRLGIFNNPL